MLSITPPIYQLLFGRRNGSPGLNPYISFPKSDILSIYSLSSSVDTALLINSYSFVINWLFSVTKVITILLPASTIPFVGGCAIGYSFIILFISLILDLSSSILFFHFLF